MEYTIKYILFLLNTKIRNKMRNTSFLWQFLALCCLVAGIYHFVGIFYKVNQPPPWRHAIFVVVNIYCIYGLLKRPFHFVYFLAILGVHQYYVHGSMIINQWEKSHTIHWLSVGVLVFFPIAVALLSRDKTKIH